MIYEPNNLNKKDELRYELVDNKNSDLESDEFCFIIG